MINRGERNNWVVIDCIDKSTVQSMYLYIHFHESKQKFYEVPLYCQRLRNSTPLKQQQQKVSNPEVDLPLQESTSQQQIPGLPEKDRLVAVKKSKKKKRNRSSSKQSSNTVNGKEFFFKTVKLVDENRENFGNFQFSDYSDEDSDDNFTDSREVLSDTDTQVETSTPATALKKRPLRSPLDSIQFKKARDLNRDK